MSTKSQSRLSSGLVLLMSIATGITVASNYYAQPLLHTIAANLGLSISQAGLIVTVAQLGYGLGLILLVPLGDMLERRNLIFVMTLLSAAGLLISALSQSLALLLVGTALAGLFSVVAQVLVPFAATLAAPAERGKAVGTVMGGLLMGILLARTVAGLFAVSGTWRAVYWFAAAMMIVLALILRRALPRSEPETTGLTYVGLIASIIQLIAQEPLLRTRALLGAFSFAGFALMWTAISFLLAAPPFNYSDITIGLFGLAGAAGALAASKVGKLADKGEGDLTTWVGLGLLLASWLPLAYARSSPIVLIIGIVVLDLAAQVVQVSNQSAIYRIRPEARNRLNAAYMTIYFVGGSAGSLLSAHAYQRANWAGVVWVGIALATTGLIIWMFQHKQGAADAG